MKSQLAKLDLLILDELGYVPASKLGSELLFDVISAAYERTTTRSPLSYEAECHPHRPKVPLRTAVEMLSYTPSCHSQ